MIISTTAYALFWLAMISFGTYFLTKIPVFLGTAFVLFAGSGVSSMYIYEPILFNSTTIMQYSPQFPLGIISGIFAILCVIFFFFEMFK